MSVLQITDAQIEYWDLREEEGNFWQLFDKNLLSYFILSLLIPCILKIENCSNSATVTKDFLGTDTFENAQFGLVP